MTCIQHCSGRATTLSTCTCASFDAAVAGEGLPAVPKEEAPIQWGVTGDAREDYKLRTDRTAALSGEAVQCSLLIIKLTPFASCADAVSVGRIVQG